ncbi:MAG: acyl-CoA dehydrogenase family protein [Actinomycetota bacterium]|nr:acyl-CoA dehydrogenase family protein [Actinomycetota bacterium]
MMFEIPEHLGPLRDKVTRFIEQHVYPAEPVMHRGGAEAHALGRDLQSLAKRERLWALGHPTHLGGGGLPFLDYVYINEVQGRSEYGQIALGTYSLQDSLMLDRYASHEQKERFLKPLAEGEIFPSFAMTEPGRAGSDPTRLQTQAVLDGSDWVINGRKWFTTYANRAAYTTVMCRTEAGTSPHRAFSMILVPTDTPGYTIVRETPVLGIYGGHCEVEYRDVRVPAANLLGDRGLGFAIAQERLGPGRIFHAMRWLGQAQRAFDLMCSRLNEREAFGGLLAEKQLMQKHVFDSWTQIQAARMLTLNAAAHIDRGESARVEIGAIKVVGAHMLHDVIDRAIQVFGAEGLTDDTPLSFMYRTARFARLYDGPDEVHIQNVARRLLGEYAKGGSWDFGIR